MVAHSVPFPRVTYQASSPCQRCNEEGAMSQESSSIKRIAVAIAILTICGLALWASLEMALRLTSGQS